MDMYIGCGDVLETVAVYGLYVASIIHRTLSMMFGAIRNWLAGRLILSP